MPVQIGTKVSSFSDPTALLSDCHRRIEMFLNTLRVAANLAGRQLGEDERRALDAALRYFREAAPKHNADEEESLFPRLRSIAAPDVEVVLDGLSRLEREHHWAAPLHAEVDRLGQRWLLNGELGASESQSFHAAIEELVSMYRSHIDYEDQVLFPLASRILSPSQNEEMAQEMAKRRNLSTTPGAGFPD